MSTATTTTTTPEEPTEPPTEPTEPTETQQQQAPTETEEAQPVATLAEAAKAFATTDDNNETTTADDVTDVVSTDAITTTEDDDTEGAEEAPAEDPMPTPDECFHKHFAKANAKLYERFVTELTEAKQQEFRDAMSLNDQAVATEHAYRGMIPHMQNLQYMQRMMQSGQIRRNQSARQKQQLGETVRKFQNSLKEAEETYLTERDTLWSTVRDHLNTVQDDAQQAAYEEAVRTKPFSKGVIKHFWRATEHDDAQMLRETLLGADMVQRADYAVHRPHRNKTQPTCTPLLQLLTGDHHFVKQDTGAVECLRWVLQTYPELYSATDRQEAAAAIRAKGLDARRGACLAALEGE